MRRITTIPIAFALLAAAFPSGVSWGGYPDTRVRAASEAARQATRMTPTPAPGGTWRPMGEYRVTGYAACSKCCGKSDGITADGTYAPGFKGRLASAPRGIPFGTRLWIAGVGPVEVHDRGGAIKGKHVELFFQTYSQARQWGVQKRQVWVWVASD